MPKSNVPTGQQQSALTAYFFRLLMLMNTVCLKLEHICIKLSLNDVNIIFLKQWSMPTIDFSINDDDDNDDDDDDSDDDDDDDGGGKDCKYGILSKV